MENIMLDMEGQGFMEQAAVYGVDASSSDMDSRDLPKNKETYIHRIGRSGRYGRKGTAINFITDQDKERLEEIRTYYNTKIDEMPKNLEDFI